MFLYSKSFSDIFDALNMVPAVSVCFKMKGTKGKLKTTINPIRTLTPRFLQKIIDKKKQVK